MSHLTLHLSWGAHACIAYLPRWSDAPMHAVVSGTAVDAQGNRHRAQVTRGGAEVHIGPHLVALSAALPGTAAEPWHTLVQSVGGTCVAHSTSLAEEAVLQGLRAHDSPHLYVPAIFCNVAQGAAALTAIVVIGSGVAAYSRFAAPQCARA